MGHYQAPPAPVEDDHGRAISIEGTAHPREKTHRWLLTRDFSLMWWSQVLSQVADGVSKLALLWFVYALTGSPLKTTIFGKIKTQNWSRILN